MDNSFALKNLFREVDDQTVLFSQCFKIGFHDCKMNIFNIFNCFQFNKDSIIYDEIQRRPSDFNIIIFDNDLSLPLNLKILFLQLNDKSIRRLTPKIQILISCEFQ